MSAPLALDHLVVAAPTLEAATLHVERALGVSMGGGGAHPGFATHNRLLGLEDCYVEALARDPDAAPTRPRWFGLDDPRFEAGAATEPRLHAFVLRTTDLDEALAAHPDPGVRAVTARRGDLAWRIGLRDDGAMPYDGAFPTLIEWPDGAGPARTMPDNDRRLLALDVAHPRVDEIEAALRGRLDDSRVRFRRGPFSLRARVRTPAGDRDI